MLAKRPNLMSVSEFLAFIDERPGEKWELIDGLPVAMAGGTLKHARLSRNIAASVGPAARRHGCEELRDLFVSVAANDHQHFDPDVMIRCGPADETARSVDDPVAVFEVLSPSTMVYDRGPKVAAYMQIPSLRFIALVYSTEVRVEVWSREAGAKWPETPTVLSAMSDAIPVPPMDHAIALAEIYAAS
jgi:Uma2 family endonuclease